MRWTQTSFRTRATNRTSGIAIAALLIAGLIIAVLASLPS